jgi:hypothetical protein
MGVMGSFATVAALASLALLVAYLYLLYQLINRRNQHFRRQRLLARDLIALLRETGKDRNTDVGPFVTAMETVTRSMELDEGEKSPALWVVLSIIPVVNIIASLYIFYFLTRDYYRHERREDHFLEDLTKALDRLGISYAYRRVRPIPERSFALYLILTIITLGLFAIYWIYTLIQDPNQHFTEHLHHEDTLISGLDALQAGGQKA